MAKKKTFAEIELENDNKKVIIRQDISRLNIFNALDAIKNTIIDHKLFDYRIKSIFFWDDEKIVAPDTIKEDI